MRFRDSASYGKRQEYIAVAELLKRGFDVYMTLVDDQGIDCVIRINERRYLDVQIKSRSENAKPKEWAYFPLLSVPSKRDNMFFIFHSGRVDTYWVLPSEDIITLASQPRTNVSQLKNGANAGLYAVRLGGLQTSNGESKLVPFKRFDKYKGDAGFALLR